VSSSEKQDRLVQEIVETIRIYLNPRRVILFGSRASHKQRPYSDFDIAIEGAGMDIRTERVLKENLDERAGIYLVDVIDLDRADSEFRELVQSTGRVIYER